jgi:hypothetical protein
MAKYISIPSSCKSTVSTKRINKRFLESKLFDILFLCKMCQDGQGEGADDDHDGQDVPGELIKRFDEACP